MAEDRQSGQSGVDVEEELGELGWHFRGEGVGVVRDEIEIERE